MDALAFQLFGGDECAGKSLPVRGVDWVLRWAAALTALAASAVILVAFAYQLAAELALVRAASTGVREATLPRATSRSVEAAVRRQLAGRFDLHLATTIELQQNGSPVKSILRLQRGDQLSVALSAPARAALPHWLGAFVPWHGREAITTRSERQFGQ
jgi:hypothetical protein